MDIAKYSIGTGDRFGRQGRAQLAAVQKAQEQGVDLAIVWNKSHREHQIIETTPQAQRQAADQTIHELQWQGQYFVDADHISIENVDLFLPYCDFFTLDVAEYIGSMADRKTLDAFVEKYQKYAGKLKIPGISSSLDVSTELLRFVAEKYYHAIQQAGHIFRYIEANKPPDSFVAEISIDETDDPQSPAELLFILAAIADEKIPIQTIAPKFSGRFNKGVDYCGDICRFRQEFEADICVVKYAVDHFGLPDNLKLSVHSGSDKFSIYPVIRELIRKHDVGLHIKTAGTTWLEEVNGLAESGGRGFEIAKQIYCSSYEHFDALCAPYASVIDIDKNSLPDPEDVKDWTKDQFVRALRHDQTCLEYNYHMRQLVHVGFKVAARMKDDYLGALEEAEPVIARNVTENLYDRHIRALFL